ncbi:hypothetical protein OH77DRAFT_183633 [Trametes cingulata]|nr:hypothetical protein OH77DRAFT_183633 [Trametes cingulata]
MFTVPRNHDSRFRVLSPIEMIMVCICCMIYCFTLKRTASVVDGLPQQGCVAWCRTLCSLESLT